MKEWRADTIVPVYADLTRNELLTLALCPESLTDVARQALDTELQRRGIGEAEVLVFRTARAKVYAREIRWKRVRWLRLKSGLAYRLVWPLGIFVAFALWELGAFYLVQLVPGLNERQMDVYGGISQIVAAILFLGFGAFFILSSHGDVWVHRWGRGAGWTVSGIKNRRAKFHACYCAARSLSTAGFFLGFSILMVFYAYRDLNKPIPTERETLVLLVSLLYCIGLTFYCALSLTCLRERLVLGIATASFMLAFLRDAVPRFAAPYAPAVRDITLGAWVVASVVSLSLVKSAHHAAPPGFSSFTDESHK